MRVENRLLLLLAAKMTREGRMISLAELARQTGMTRQNARKWATNRIKCFPGETINALCDYLECTPGDLIVRTNQQVRQ